MEAAPRGRDAPRHPGRPRSARVDRAILEAAAELFAEVGIEGMTMEAVAARARAGKAALYRRWSTKEDLVTAAVSRLLTEIPLPDTGDTRCDLTELLRAFERVLSGTPLGRVFPRMAAEIWAGTPLGRQYVASVIVPRREHAARLLRRGVASGQLDPGTDIPAVLDALVGAVVVRHLAAAAGEGSLPDLAKRVVHVALGPNPAKLPMP